MEQNTFKPLMLIFPFNRLAHYLRCLTLAKHLRSYFEIHFANSEEYRSFVLKDGFSTFTCESLDADQVMAKARKFDFSWINKQNMEPVLASQVEAIERLKPYFVLGDTSLTLKMAAEKTGTFYISLMNGYMSKYYSPRRKLSTTHPSYKYLRLLPPKAITAVTAIGETASFRKTHKPFKELRKQYGLKKLNIYPDEMEGDLNLICDLPELFPQNPLPPNYCWIPPLYHLSNSKNSIGIQQHLDPNKKTILVTMGSTGDWHKVAFLNDDQFKIYNLVVAGDCVGAVSAAHAIQLPFINMHEVLPYTDLVLCHGGNGTSYLALLYGVPLLCMTDHFEQEWNVDMLEKTGLCEILNGKSPTDIIDLIGEWVEKKDAGVQLAFKVKMQEASGEWDEVISNVVCKHLKGVEGLLCE